MHRSSMTCVEGYHEYIGEYHECTGGVQCIAGYQQCIGEISVLL